MRHIEIEGGYNIRELGGYPTEDGRVTRWHTLIRAGGLDQVSAAGQEQLLASGVKTVIDIRDENEAQNMPDVFAQSKTITYLNLPFINVDFTNSASWSAATADFETLAEIYAGLLDHCQVEIGRIIAAVVDSPPITLFHCHVGKDRTGLVTALILAAVRVPDAVIAEDYALTNQRISHLIPQWHEEALQNGDDMRNFDRDIGSDAQTMITTLNTIKAKYGSAAHYLHQCGVSDDQLARLRSLMVE